jgi:hypothetical protein
MMMEEFLIDVEKIKIGVLKNGSRQLKKKKKIISLLTQPIKTVFIIKVLFLINVVLELRVQL